ncbi:hypothetical protein [Photobacterium damselae]|uniref:hypothetical protein n=1 Tax=Photobacterium damselae TaxID=38293 RepID=UPI001F3DDE5C|nr:hypothetical protein [Photobacterium damselae]UKA04854.1 hypothetical protein IHC89_21665 [Photobacterium damselae subsp. damselae]
MENEIIMFAFQRLRTLSQNQNENRVNADSGLRRQIIETMRKDTFAEFPNVDEDVIKSALTSLSNRLIETM